MTYSEEDYLQLSGIQHFKFCRRRWALIHIEQQWADNYRTVDGTLMHERAHDTGLKESRGDLFITRGINFFSSTLGVSGQCDVLEFRRSADGIELKDREVFGSPIPLNTSAECTTSEPAIHCSFAVRQCALKRCLRVIFREEHCFMAKHGAGWKLNLTEH